MKILSRLNFKKSNKGKLRNKISMILLVEALLIIGLLFTVMYTQSYKMVVSYLGDKALEMAELSAEKIDVSEFKKLKNVEDENQVSYKKMREELNNIRKISGSRYIYTIRLNENKEYVYVVDGADFDDKEASRIGDTEIEYPGFKEAIAGQTHVGKEMEVDEYGVFVSSYFPIKDENDVVIGFAGVDYDVEKMYIKFKKFRNIAVSLSFIIGLASIIFGIIISRKITRPIEVMAEISNKVANYDLKVEKMSIKNKDEIGVLANSINIMIDNLKSIMLDVKETSENVEFNSIQLREQAEQTGKASEEIAIATTEIANGTAFQTEHIDKIVTDIGEHLNEVSEGVIKSEQSFETAKLSTQIAFDGKMSINKSIENLDYVSRTIEFATNSIQNLGKRSNEISNIVNVIANVAAQTNLLALNASIEAARAGEHGKGFAVVADEIRKLADQSEQSTKGITELINDIISETSVAVRTMESNLESINVQVHMIKEGGNALDEIVNKVEETEKNSKDINETFQKIKEISNQVAESITKISTIVQEASANTEEVAASAEEQSAITEEMSMRASKLSNIIKNLNNKVDEFALK